MLNKFAVGVLLLALVTIGSMPAVAQAEGPKYKVTELADGLYMLEGDGAFVGGNMGLLTGPDGAVLIDDGLPPLTDNLLAAIKKVTDAKIEYLVNTHVHGDHTGGNAVMGERGARIIAHERLRSRMIEQGITGANGNEPAPKEALPVLTFADSVSLHLNGREAFVFHVANAHTDGDSVIHFKEDNVVHTGDTMFSGIFPYIDLDSGGSLAGYIAAQKKIYAMVNDETKIIPGHGPLSTKKDLAASIAMLEKSSAAIEALISAGHTEEEILEANPLAEFDADWSWQFINTERMTKTLYRALKK